MRSGQRETSSESRSGFSRTATTSRQPRDRAAAKAGPLPPNFFETGNREQKSAYWGERGTWRESEEGIPNLEASEALAVLKILREQEIAARLESSRDNQ